MSGTPNRAPNNGPTIVALSGGVDSAVAALLLRDAGHDVQCLHMTNWEDDGYCDSARDFHDARRVCQLLGVPLHRANFAREYREHVFANFLAEHRNGRTPNPDVLCNREIKFGAMACYARRLGAAAIATGHYARLSGAMSHAPAAARSTGAHTPQLLKARDGGKDQSYFLAAVAADEFRDVLFPLGDLMKSEVRAIARRAGLAVAEKKDSTGICFIGERPFAEFLAQYLPRSPGPIVDERGREIGVHDGLAYYTLGQRHGLRVGGVADRPEAPWYVAGKDAERNELLVVQGHDHPLLFDDWLAASDAHWIGVRPSALAEGKPLRCAAKIRYRQPDQACTVTTSGEREIEVSFDQPQRTPTPGQYLVLYDGERCLGGRRHRASRTAAGSARAPRRRLIRASIRRRGGPRPRLDASLGVNLTG
ncbi:MAG TPA: tRNA 2-thiouridine(34) synthase MnmA [Gammaproteobacteria bacterium]|nr:tRNA 2-thiouridine(34) synthase MnmA [Gammaproteobacteria bacterium]